MKNDNYYYLTNYEREKNTSYCFLNLQRSDLFRIKTKPLAIQIENTTDLVLRNPNALEMHFKMQFENKYIYIYQERSAICDTFEAFFEEDCSGCDREKREDDEAKRKRAFRWNRHSRTRRGQKRTACRKAAFIEREREKGQGLHDL